MEHQPSRIAITTPLLAVPPTYFVTEHAEELRRSGAGFQFHVFPLAADIKDPALELPISPALRLGSRYAMRKRLAPLALPLQLGAVLRARPHLVHQHHGVWTLAAATAATSLRVPLVTTFHGTDATTAALNRPRGLQRVHQQQSRLAFRRAARILAVSEHLRGVLISAGATPEKVRVHYQGIDTAEFQPSLGAPMDKEVPQILYVGGLIPLKRVDLLIRASLQLVRSVPHQLTIAGEGPLRAHLERLSSEATHVRFLGSIPRSEVITRMQAADVLCLPSRNEGAGLVLLEAQSCGVPVVVTGGDGKSEMLRDGETGRVVSPNPEPAELARALEEWMPDSPRMRQDIAQRTRGFVIAERSVRSGAERLAEHYEDLLG